MSGIDQPMIDAGGMQAMPDQASLLRMEKLIKEGIDGIMRVCQNLPSETAALMHANANGPAEEDLAMQQRQWQNELDQANLVAKELEARLASKEKDLQNALVEVARLQQKEAKFRTIILNQAVSQKVSDQEVRDRFLGLRQRIQAVVNGSAFDMMQTPRLSRRREREDSRYFESTFWKNLLIGDRKNRMMAQTFLVLNDRILDFPCFGLEGFTYLVPVDEAHGKYSKKSFEQPLRKLEHELAGAQVEREEISAWRISTIECAEKLAKATNFEPLTCQYAVDEILNFCSPLLAKAEPTIEKKLEADLIQVCKEAFALRMIMRKSKDEYRCEYPQCRTPSGNLREWEDLVEPWGVEGGKNNEQVDEVAYTVFGALVKYPRDQLGSKKVLEKAFVILKRR